MRHYAVTIGPDSPATHTGLGPQLRRRRPHAVLPVIPAGQAGTFAGAIGGRRTGSSAPADATSSSTPTAPGSAPDGCCG